MKLWIDDMRPAPDGYIWCKGVNGAITTIMVAEVFNSNDPITIIDIDHDAGAYYHDGGDYIRVLDWLEETNRSYPIRIHSMNPVGVANMRRIIERNGWKEIR